MTEPELIEQLTLMMADAAGVLASLRAYATTDADVTFKLHGGVTLTVPSVPRQVGQFNTSADALKLAFATDFGGAVATQVVTRDSLRRLGTTTTTLSTGWQIVQTFGRNAAGRISSITQVVKNELGATLATVTRTLNYDAAGLYASTN